MLAVHLLCILALVLDMDGDNVLAESKLEIEIQNISDDVGWEWIYALLLLAKTESDTVVFSHCFKMWVLLQPIKSGCVARS